MRTSVPDAMLAELRIKNFAIIESLSLPLARGFNVLSGETGAGKSIIVGALGLLLGERASTDLIRTGADRATVDTADATSREDADARRVRSEHRRRHGRAGPATGRQRVGEVWPVSSWKLLPRTEPQRAPSRAKQATC